MTIYQYFHFENTFQTRLQVVINDFLSLFHKCFMAIGSFYRNRFSLAMVIRYLQKKQWLHPSPLSNLITFLGAAPRGNASNYTLRAASRPTVGSLTSRQQQWSQPHRPSSAWRGGGEESTGRIFAVIRLKIFIEF